MNLHDSNFIADAINITPENIKIATKGLPIQISIAIRMLLKLENGALTVKFPDGRVFRFDSHNPGPDAVVSLHNWKLPGRAASSGSVGVAESYMDGDWDSPDVTTFLELFCANMKIGNRFAAPKWLNNIVAMLRHWFNDNTKIGSKRNIAAHYDLGNDFYQLWLDPSMTYSSAIFEKGANSLQKAQDAKYRSLAEKSGVTSGSHILEIGCGWGGFAEYVAKNMGAKVTGLTISKEQHDYSRERIQKAGLNEQVDIKLQDYREETGKYDAIASIEMFEAVGEKFWPVYFSKVRDCLKEGCTAGLQIITIGDDHFEFYRQKPDFIQRYIFPGGMLPSPAALKNVTGKAGLMLAEERIFPQDYGKTLKEWRLRFREKWGEVRKLGFDLRFKRMWEFYFHYCEAGFRNENIDVRQMFYKSV